MSPRTSYSPRARPGGALPGRAGGRPARRALEVSRVLDDGLRARARKVHRARVVATAVAVSGASALDVRSGSRSVSLTNLQRAESPVPGVRGAHRCSCREATLDRDRAAGLQVPLAVGHLALPRSNVSRYWQQRPRAWTFSRVGRPLPDSRSRGQCLVDVDGGTVASIVARGQRSGQDRDGLRSTRLIKDLAEKVRDDPGGYSRGRTGRVTCGIEFDHVEADHPTAARDFDQDRAKLPVAEPAGLRE